MSFNKASFRHTVLAYYGSQIGPRPVWIPEFAPKRSEFGWLRVALPGAIALIAAIAVISVKPWVYRGKDLSSQREEYVQAYGTSAQYFKAADALSSSKSLKKAYIPGSAFSKGFTTNAFILSFFQALYAEPSFPVTDVPVDFQVDCPVHEWTLYSRLEVLSTLDPIQGVLNASILFISTPDSSFLSDADLASEGLFQHFEITYDPQSYAVTAYSMSLMPNHNEIEMSDPSVWDFEHSVGGRPYLFSPEKDSGGNYSTADQSEFDRLKQEAIGYRDAFAKTRESVKKAAGDYASIYQSKVKEFALFA